MNATTRRRIGGYIWNEHMARIHRALGDIRMMTADIIGVLEVHPVSVRLLLTYAAQIALHLNTATAALMELEAIANDHRKE